MDISEMSVDEAREALARQRRNDRLRAWGGVGVALLVAAALCLLVAPATGSGLALMLPVLGLVAVVGYAFVELSGRV